MIHWISRATSSRLGWGRSSGGINPPSTYSPTRFQDLRCDRADFSSAKLARLRPAFGLVAPWQPVQYFARNGRTVESKADFWLDCVDESSVGLGGVCPIAARRGVENARTAMAEMQPINPRQRFVRQRRKVTMHNRREATSTLPSSREYSHARSSQPSLRCSMHLPQRCGLEFQCTTSEFFFPLVHERPVDGAGTEVGQVGVGFEAGDRRFDQAVVLAEDRSVRGEKVFGVRVADALQAGDEIGQVGAVVGVDEADAAVSENIVAREQELAHAECELSGGVTGRAPDLEGLVADLDERRPR